MNSNNQKNNKSLDINYTYIGLLSHKINIGIIGGKKSAYIKCKAFSKKGCNVMVLAQEFSEEFNEFSDKDNVILINGSYTKAFLENKHLVVIALSDNDTAQKIIEHCELSCKLYLNCNDFRKGKFITPFQRESDAVSFGLNIKNASPVTTRYLGGKILKELKKYDAYVKFVSLIRQELKGKDRNQQVMEFLSSDDFYFFYEIGKGETIYKLFFGGFEFE